MALLPKISVITPSFNQGEFIEATIMSVLGQNYPNLEYILIDGGSTDETVDVVRKYEDKLDFWVSEKDNGQSHAINKGFARATGDIMCWLNSDDLYMPNIFSYVVQHLHSNDDAILFGNTLHFREGKNGVRPYGSDVVGDSALYALENGDYIIQPSSFWTKKVWEKIGALRENVHYAFDWEWFLRAKKMGTELRGVSKCLSMYRIHDNHKTGIGGGKRQQEILKIYKEYSPRYAELYESILRENTDMTTFKGKSVSFLLKALDKSSRHVDVFKLANYFKYKRYTTNEIQAALSMM